MEAAARRYEREHNDRAWLAWHVAALSRAKKMPDVKKLYLKRTESRRQSWREQLQIMSKWAADRQAAKALREKMDGR